MRPTFGIGRDKREAGMALVLVVLVLSILTTMVVEFAYGIYVNTSLLNNWKRLQSVSLAAESGISLAFELKNSYASNTKSNLHGFQLPLMPIEGTDLSFSVSVTDESSKFNLNSIVHEDGTANDKQMDMLRRLLRELGLADTLSDSIKDHISELGYGKRPMGSPEELLLVAGVDRGVYNSISPFVTVYGGNQINLNTAQAEVIASLSDQIGLDDAEAVVEFQSGNGKFNAADLNKGFEGFTGKFDAALAKYDEGPFMIDVIARDPEGLTREIKCVFTTEYKVLYWRER